MAGRPPFDQFDESEDIESYLDRLGEYFIAYEIEDDEDNAAKRRAILPQADQAMVLLMICNGRSRFDSNDRNAP